MADNASSNYRIKKLEARSIDFEILLNSRTTEAAVKYEKYENRFSLLDDRLK